MFIYLLLVFRLASEDKAFGLASEKLFPRQFPRMAAFAGRFALKRESLVGGGNTSSGCFDHPTIASPQFQTTVDGMGEEMVRSDCGDLNDATD